MPRQPILSDSAPRPLGPYSQAVRASNAIYLSGQTPTDPSTGRLVDGDVAAQAGRAFDNLAAVCQAAGGSFADVVRIGVYLTDLGDFESVNAVMAGYFDEPYPARTTIGVAALPKGARVEIDAIVVLPETGTSTSP
jgi:reactive intermediate/imine deaminase